MLRLAPKTKEILKAYLFMLPTFLFYSVFLVFPVLFSLFISFRDWNMLVPPLHAHFVGFENYLHLFQFDPVFKIALKNTIRFVFVAVPVSTASGLLLAVAIAQLKRGGAFWRFLLFVPSITAPVAVGLLWASLYRANYGLINLMLNFLGFSSVNWLTDPKIALWSIMFAYVWSQAGATTLILFAGLRNIPEHYYEAATIDGASATRQFLNISLPLLRPTFLFVLVTGAISAWQIFDPVIAMSAPDYLRAGGPVHSTQVMGVYMYQTAFNYMRMGRATAMAYVLFLIILVTSIALLRIFKEGGVESY